MFSTALSIFGAALAVFALLAVWLALETPRRLLARPAGGSVLAKRIAGLAGPASYFAAYFDGVRKAFKYPRLALTVTLRPAEAIRFGLMPAMCGGSPELDEDVELTDGEKVEQKKIEEQVADLRSKLMGRIGEMEVKGEDKAELEKREAELAKQVDKLIGFAKKQESDEVKDFKAELEERVDAFEKTIKEYFAEAEDGPRGALKKGKQLERYKGDNLFLDMREAIKTHDQALSSQLHEYEQKFNSAERQKAWATEDLEDVDLIIPDIQQALPFLRARARVVQLFRELRTSSPAVEFPVFKTGLTVGHVKEGEGKPESDPTFDLEVARVFTIAGISDVPNPTLEDFPAARGWISTELGAATGAQEETDVLMGGGVGEPLGILENEDVPVRQVDEVAKASNGRNFMTSIFRAAQQVRVEGFVEPTDAALNPAVWTDIALSFEDAIGFLYGPPQASTSGAPADTPPPRVLGLPITWSSYIPLDAGEGEDESPIIVGNFQDGIVLRRSPFRIDIDTSVGFKKNLTSFRGEERMGFIVVRPMSFVVVEGVKPTPVV
jgi:HK97 family phage major capsid protein